MGDGEATASAVECALDATFRLTISDDFHVTRPVVAAETEVMTTGEGATMEEASNGALNAMAELMVERLAIDYTDAAMLIASAADVRTGLAGNPPYTMRAAIPRSMLSV
jgi:amidase